MSVHPVRVAVVNDFELVVAGVAAMLAPFSDQVVVVELDSGVPPVCDVDVVLVDTFGQGEGEHLSVDDLLDDGKPRVVVYSWNTRPDVVERTMARGAAGYLPKSARAEEIVATVVKVHAGEAVRPQGGVDADLAAELADGESSGSWPGKAQGLSAREAEVVSLISRGLSNQEIAERTYLSINSVKTYIRTAYRKIGVTRRSQAVAWGLQHGLLPDRSRQVQPLDS